MKMRSRVLAWLLAGSMVLQGAVPVSASAAGIAEDDGNAAVWEQTVRAGEVLEDSATVVLADFSFDEENENGGFDGGNAAAVKNGSNISLEEHEDNGMAVKLGSGSFLNVTAADGSSLLTGWDEVTVSFDLKATANLSWIFYAAPDTSAPSWPTEKYYAFLREAGKNNFVVQRYNNTTGRPASASTSIASGEWHHVEVQATEDNTVIIVDDVQAASQSSTYRISDILKGSSILQIGKANWGSGEYSDMVLDNFKITASITDSVTMEDTLEVMEGKSKKLSVTGYSAYASPEITYKSDNEAVASVDQQGNVQGVAEGSAVITAVVSMQGATKELTAQVTVMPKEEAKVVASLDFDEESIGSASAVVTKFADYTGTLSFEEGRVGKAVRLNGYGLRLNQKNVGQSYTVSMWMKHDDVLKENQQILFLGHGDNSSENWLDIAGDRGSNQTYQVWTRNTTASSSISGWKYLDESKKQAAGEWAMLTVTGNGTDFCAYLNGEPFALNGSGSNADALKNAANVLSGENQDIYIGINYWDSIFGGLVDDVTVYDQDLSADQVQDLYEKQYTEYVAEHFRPGNLSEVSDNLILPDSEGKASITWSSDREDVLANDGTVIRPDEDTQVILTAVFRFGNASVEKNYTVNVKHKDVTADLQEAYDALTLCTVTASDLALPAAGKKGAAITWSSSDPSVLGDDGTIVSRPAAGEGNAQVTLTAVIAKAGEKVEKTFQVEVLEAYYGYIYGYITGDNDRTGSLHLAYSRDGENFTALNSNAGVHFAKNDPSNGDKTLSTGIRFNEISLFRKADGSFGLAAPQGKDAKKLYLYDSKDLITYTNEILLTTNTGIGAVSDVAVQYDASIGGYDLYWSSGDKQYVNTTADLLTLNEEAEASYTVPEWSLAQVPEGAKKGSVIGVTKAEYDRLVSHFAGVTYSKTQEPQSVTVNTAAEIKSALPKSVSVSYDDGSASAMDVTWDVDTPDFSKAGTYTVTGTLKSYDNPLTEQRADPQIVYDETENCYYFTASYPAYGNVNSGYDRIVLRKADSISGLSDESTEITIWTAPSSGTMARHVWAPELHKIAGKWYLFFAAGNSDNIWAIRPYVLVCQGDDPYVAENWKKADGSAEVYAATSKDSSKFTHMSLDMTYFTDEDAEGITHHYVIWAELSPSSLYMQEINPDRPWEGISDVILLTTPEYGWERDSELVNEGPSILKHDGKIFCTFSASGTGPEYCIGLLYADETSDLMNPDSWTKLSYPLLTSEDVPGEYGPGHNSFTVDADGNPVFVYHARSEECYNDKCQWASSDPLYDPCRHARVKNVHWSADGLPILNMSAEEELPEEAKTVTIQVVVLQDSEELRDLSDAEITGADTVVETGAQICPEITVKWGTAVLKEGTDYEVSYGENVNRKGTVTITAKEGGRYTGSKTAEFQILAAVIADFSFDDLEEGLRGGNAVAAVAGGSIELVAHEDGYAAKFEKNDQDYLDVKAADGSSLLAGYDEITVSYDILPETSGTHWVYYASQDDTMLSWGTNGNHETYLGVLVKNGKTEVERYHNNGSRPTNPSVSMTAGKWQHIDIVYAKDRTVVYLDGKRVSMVASGYALTDILGDGSFFQIGKANWAPGEYSTMQLDNFKIAAGTRLYEEDRLNQAKVEIAEKLGDLSNVTENLELLQVTSDGLTVSWDTSDPSVITAKGVVTVPKEENVTVTLTASISDGNKTVTETYQVTVLAKGNVVQKLAAQLTLPYSTKAGKEVYGNITLPDTVNGTGEVTWTTDHPEIINVREIPGEDGYDPTPAGTVTRPERDTVVTMTATVTLDGNQAEKIFTFTVKAAPEELTEDDYTDYFFAYFTGEGYSNGEQIYFSASHDGLNWKDLNNNEPTLTSTMGEKGVRDPFIIRSPEGDKFYLIATDLKINGGNGWTAAQEAGSQALMVWESTDLVNWSEQRMVTVSADIAAGCTWAPEAAYDARTGEYVVYWASKVASDGYAKQRLYYAKTRDFYSFTEPKVYIEYDQSSIDTTMIEYNGTYYRYTKNEGGATNELGAQTKTIFIEKSSDVLGTFTQIPSTVLNSRDNQYVEGPTIFKLNKDDAETDTWCLLVDDFGGGGYYPLLTTDLESGEFTRLTEGYQLPGGSRFPRHGTPIRITAKEYAAVAKAYHAEREQLSSIKLDGEAFEEFQPSQKDYRVIKADADPYPVVDGTFAGEELTLEVTQATAENPKAVLTLKNALGETESVYTITFVNESELSDEPVLEYNFESATADGMTAVDTGNGSRYGYDGKLYGKAAIVTDEELGSKVLKLTGGDKNDPGYLEFPRGFFDGRDTMTIMMDVKSELSSGNFFTFTFGQDATVYSYLRVRGTTVRNAITTGSWSTEKDVQGSLAASGKWRHIALVFEGKKLSLYINGQLKNTNSSTDVSVSQMGSNLLAYLGKSFYGDDIYAKASYDNVKVYEKALTEEEIRRQTKEAQDAFAKAAPQELKAVVQGSEITLTWNAMEDAGSYVIFRRKAGEELLKRVAVVGGDELTWTDAQTREGADYIYVVKGCWNEDGNGGLSAASEECIAGIPAAEEPDRKPLPEIKPVDDEKKEEEKPDQPVTVNLPTPTAAAKSADYHTIQISWSASAGAKSYVIFRRTGNAAFAKVASVDASVLTFRDTTAVTGQKYDYCVQAVSAKGNSGLSRSVSAEAVPAAPSVKVKATKSGAKVTWKKVKVSAKSYAASYQIYRKKGSGKWKKLTTVKASKLSYLDKKAKKGTYYYRVRAVVKQNGKTIYGDWITKGKKVKAK